MYDEWIFFFFTLLVYRYHWGAVTSMNSMLIEFDAPTTLLYGYDIIFTQPKDHELQIF